MCRCSHLAPIFYIEEAPPGFLDSLTEKAVSPWQRLCVCPACGTSWAVDHWDKFQDQVVARVPDESRWDEHSEAERKALLLRSRGGNSEEKCIWAGCEKKRVRGVALCIDHLYATGTRR